MARVLMFLNKTNLEEPSGSFIFKYILGLLVTTGMIGCFDIVAAVSLYSFLSLRDMCIPYSYYLLHTFRTPSGVRF
jgi:hypothetical protein